MIIATYIDNGIICRKLIKKVPQPKDIKNDYTWYNGGYHLTLKDANAILQNTRIPKGTIDGSLTNQERDEIYIILGKFISGNFDKSKPILPYDYPS